MEQATRQRRSRGCERAEGHQVGVGEEPARPDSGAAGLVGVAVKDQLGPVSGVPAQGATPAGVLDQGRNRPGTARRVAGLGPTLAAPRVRHTRRHDQTVPAADLQHPRSRPVQRTLGSHEHAPTSTYQTCQRIPHTRSVHRHGHAHPRRPVPGAAKPPMKTAGGPQLHPDKTTVVYCKDSNRREAHANVSFTFLGYTFRPRRARNKRKDINFTSFLPAMSRDKLIEKSREVRRWRLHRRPNDTLDDLARAINPIVRGWMVYWGRFYRTEMDPLLTRINTYLMRWARKKYRRLHRFKRLKAWWQGVVQRDPTLFAHWAWTPRFQPTGW